MSLGSLGMARSALGTALSLVLLTHIIQGQQDVKVFHYKKMEAVEGQDVALPCLLNGTNLQLGNIEWSRRRNETTKLVVYNAMYGLEYYWPNVTIQIENNTMGSYLHLNQVTRRDSGTYICELSTFPLGSIKSETVLKVGDPHVKIACDVESPVKVNVGENVTIQCKASPDSHYRWTKNKTLVSVNEYLELLWVTDAHAGLYILTVDTGSTSQHKEFIITVLRATTSQWTDVWTKQPQSTVSEKGVTESADTNLTTSTPANEHLTNDSDVTQTMAADVTHNPSDVYVTAGQNVTSYTNYTRTAVTSSRPTHPDPYKSDNSSDQQTNQTWASSTSPFPDHPASGNLSTSNGTTVFNSTEGMRNESAMHTVHPDVSPSTSRQSSTLGGFTVDSNNTDATSTLVTVNVEVKKDGTQSHLLVLMIVPVLVLILVAAFLYRKQIIKKRMDLPPPFKPPPPPVKYTAARHREILTEPAIQRTRAYPHES